jgi:hypothetical protein
MSGLNSRGAKAFPKRASSQLVAAGKYSETGTVQAMTEVPRGARSRRSGRGTGWMLLTSLLVLAILASSTLVFTNRVELLRLAVVLSLWAAVVAAFVTVIYRRQSETDRARARDMKFVYDLQLDREISARREYELSVESQLRRTLSREIRAEAADEMSGLRAELAALRSQLEVMLGADLGHRPALERERIAVPMPTAPGRVESSRVTVVTEEVVTVAHEALVENAIIDVPEEPLVVEPAPVPAAAAPRPAQPPPPPAQYRGGHWRPADAVAYTRPGNAVPQQPEAPWRPPEVRLGRHSSDGGERPEPPAPRANVTPEPVRGRHWVPPQSQPVPAGRHRGQDDVVPEPVAEEPQGQHADGQSFADLMARFEAKPASLGGGRRRRED